MTQLPYRQGANAIVIDSENNYLLVQKNSYAENQWDFPGGGLDEEEAPEVGILRELEEELGTSSFEILFKSTHKLKFDWPQEARDRAFKKHGVWYAGQEKHVFVVKFNGDKEQVKLQAEEIRKIKWVSYPELKENLLFEGQWATADRVIHEAKLI